MVPDFRETATLHDGMTGLTIGVAHGRSIAADCAKRFGAERAGAKLTDMPPGPLANQAASRSPDFDKLPEKTRKKAPALDAATRMPGDAPVMDGGYHIID